MQRIFFLLLAIVLFGCDAQKPQNPQYDNQIQELRDKIQKLETQESLKELGQYAYLTTGDNGYGTIITKLGSFYVALVNAKEYVNGYKILIKIGNPNFVTFKDTRIGIVFGKNYEGKKVDTVPLLRPGSWTYHEITIAPIDKKDLGMLMMGIYPNSIYLYN